MLWACIWLPHLALDGVLRRRPPMDAPLVLVSGSAQMRMVYAVNAAAHAAGLRRGQRLGAAQALLGHFETVEHDPDADQRTLRFLAAWAYRYSSDVVMFPHAIVLEVSRSLSLFGPWPRFEGQLREDLNALGFHHRIALAPTAHAAHVFALRQDGLAVMTRDAMQRALAAITVQHAQLPDDAATALTAMGIRSVGQLLRLPRDSLLRRFNATLTDYLDRLTGDAPELMEGYRPSDTFDQRMEWTHEIEQVQALVFPLRRLTADLAAYLAGRDGGVQRFAIELEHRGASPTRVLIGMLTAERDAALLFECARTRLERKALPHPVVAMRLIARELPPFVPAGRDLFDPRPAHAVPLEQLRERLRARLGESAIQRLQRTVDPRPEFAQTLATNGAPAASRRESLPRPTWLLETPRPLRGPAPTILAGPERIETGWWDGGDMRRDYYVVLTPQGQRAWVFSAPGTQGPWMLHGWFA